MQSKRLLKNMNDNKFHSDVEALFESYLSIKNRGKVLVKDKKKNQIVTKMNYNKVLFDSNLNIYKIDNSGKAVLVTDSNFEAVVVKR